jgi:hypothetical protein
VTLDELKETLARMKPRRYASINYGVYAELFPPGEPDQNARAACYELAKSVGCRIENRSQTQEIWFIKDA